MSVSEKAGEAVAGFVFPETKEILRGSKDDALLQSGLDLMGVEDAALSQIIKSVGAPVVRGARRYVVDSLTQTRGNTVTASDVLESGSVPDAIKNRELEEFHDAHVDQNLQENTAKTAKGLTKSTFQLLGYSNEQAEQMADGTVAGGLMRGAYSAGLRKYEQVSSEAADQLYGRRETQTNTKVPSAKKTGHTARDAALTASALQERLLERGLKNKDFVDLRAEDINVLTRDTIHGGKYDLASNDFERGHKIADEVADSAQSVRNLRRVYGEDASVDDMMQHTSKLRGSDVRTMSKSRRDALTGEAARVAQNTGMDASQLTVAAAQGYSAAAEYGLEKEAGYRIGLSAQKQLGGQGIRVEGLDEDQYREEVSRSMAASAESGAVTDSAAAYRAYLDASGRKDTDETFKEWQEKTKNVDFADSAQAQKYIAKTLGVSGKKAAEAYDAYANSVDTKRMAESRDFYSATFQKQAETINNIGYEEQKKALKDAGIDLHKAFKSRDEYNSMTQQERRDKIRDYAKKNKKDIVKVESALAKSDARFKTTAEYHGLSAEAADQAIVASRSSEKLANKSGPQEPDRYNSDVEGVAQHVTKNAKAKKETSVSDLATTLVTGTDQESLQEVSKYVDRRVGRIELPEAATSMSKSSTPSIAQPTTGTDQESSAVGILQKHANSIVSEQVTKSGNEGLLGILNSILQTLQQLRDRVN